MKRGIAFLFILLIGISLVLSERRDLAFLADESVLSQDIVSMIWASDEENWLKSVDVFDVYSGKGIPEGKKSIALGLTLQHASRTLIDEEISDFVYRAP